jgi:hypothetical protein
MKHTLKIFAVACALILPLAPETVRAQSGCYADYKAKRDAGGTMQLHYGVIQLDQQSCQNAGQRTQIVARRIAADGWTLLGVLSTFDQSGLNQRQGNAGKYFLRY